MRLKALFIAALLMLTTSCRPQPVTPPVITATLPQVTATSLPVETPTPATSSGNIFASIPLNSVPAFSIESVAQAAFEVALKGQVREYRVDSVAVFPSGEGSLIAEIVYSLRADIDLWPEDGGTAAADGWITGKCSRFDLVATATEHQLKNKRLCS